MFGEVLNECVTKGNQIKYVVNGYLYKEDTMGYESTSEYIVSLFLSCVEGIEYIHYHPSLSYNSEETTNIEYKVFCMSKIYNTNGESFIPIYKILDSYGYYKYIIKYKGKDKLNYVVKCVKEAVGLDIRNYLGVLAYIDYIILNEDRHFGNISLIEKDGVYRVVPIYDNGLSLLSNTGMYPMGIDIDKLIRKVKSEPFSTNFKKQVGYFDNPPLVVRIDEFYSKLKHNKDNLDRLVPFNQEEYLRAEKVLLRRLKETEGWLWVKK